MPDAVKLEPCGNKYCHGEKPFLSYSRKHGYRVHCRCGVRGPAVSAYGIGADAAMAQALTAWNTRTPSTTASTEGAWQPIETVGTFEEVTVYEAGNGQAIGHRDAMGEWWSPLPLRPLNMNPTHWKPLGPNPASPQGADR